MTRTPFIALACAFCAALLGASPSRAQVSYSFGLGPEITWITVEHTKTVTIGGGSSTSTSAASGPGLAARMFGAVQTGLSGGSLRLGGGIEVIVPARRVIEGRISPTNSGNPHDVWPGRWDFRDRIGVGATFRVGRYVGDGNFQAYGILGARRMRSEFATGGTNPETGIAGEDRTRLARWPASVGAGLTLGGRWPTDLRITYTRSTTDWLITQPGLQLDYRYVTSGVVFSVGIGRPGPPAVPRALPARVYPRPSTKSSLP